MAEREVHGDAAKENPALLDEFQRAEREASRKDCPQCGKRFLRPSHLRRHLLSHKTESGFPCTVCNRSFKQKAHLKRHALSVHADLLDPLVVGSRPPEKTCKCCGKGFVDSWMLKRHCRSVHSGAGLETSDTAFHCNRCGRRHFQSKQHLLNHVQRHMGLRPHACDHCDLAFRRRRELENHLAAKHRTIGPLWHCRVCDESFIQRVQVERHWKAQHATPFAATAAGCRHCGATVDDVQEHIRTFHFYRASQDKDDDAANPERLETPEHSQCCKLTLVVRIADDSKPVNQLLLHNSLPYAVLQCFQELVHCEVQLTAQARPGTTLVLEFDAQYAEGSYGPPEAAYLLVYKE